MTDPVQLLPVKKFAPLVGTSHTTLYRLIKAGVITPDFYDTLVGFNLTRVPEIKAAVAEHCQRLARGTTESEDNFEKHEVEHHAQ